jgi:hypothetical protein
MSLEQGQANPDADNFFTSKSRKFSNRLEPVNPDPGRHDEGVRLACGFPFYRCGKVPSCKGQRR